MQNAGQLLPSNRNYYQLNSGHTFNGGNTIGSKLNTKTNAQLTAAKGSNIITPKVNTIGADPETHRKMLEKMLQEAELNPDKDAGAGGNVISMGGAFTKNKKASEHLSNSGSKNKKDSASKLDNKHDNLRERRYLTEAKKDVSK
jgi:hypothetical protein